jgi:hypothetical protein
MTPMSGVATVWLPPASLIVVVIVNVPVAPPT